MPEVCGTSAPIVCGSKPHGVGPPKAFRQRVSIFNEWAKAAVTSWRASTDLHGDDLVEQLTLVMDAMRSQLHCRRFIAVGLCSGAFAAFQAAIQISAIRSIVLLNPRLLFWDPETEPRRLAKRVGSGYANLDYWRRLLKGEIQPERLKEAARAALSNLFRIGRNTQIPAAAMARAWRQ